MNLERLGLYTIFCILIPPVDVPRKLIASLKIHFHMPVCLQVMTKLDRDVTVKLTRYIGLIASIDSSNMCFLIILFVMKRCHWLHIHCQERFVQWMFYLFFNFQR